MLIWLVWAVLSSAQAADLNLEYVLPDPAITPGVATLMSVKDICAKRWGTDRRFVTAAMKRRVFESYGLTGNDDDTRCHLDAHGRRFEVDHLISRELGGADDVLNLWPQCYSGPYNAIMKDRVENRLHKEICTGHLTLDEAQEQIRTDWRVPYRRYFEERN
jgi:hypothetical protein